MPFDKYLPPAVATDGIIDTMFKASSAEMDARVRELATRKTFAQRIEDAELLGLIVCTCLGIDHDNRRTVIIDPSCKVHNDRCTTCQRAF